MRGDTVSLLHMEQETVAGFEADTRIRDIKDVDDVTMIRYNGEYHG